MTPPRVSRTAQGHFHHDAGCKEGFHQEHGAQDGDARVNERHVSIGEYLHEEGGEGAEEHTQACHEDEGVPHAFPDGDAGHQRIPGAQVLPHQCGGCHADGEAGQEAEGFNAHGNVVDAQHARDGKLADDGETEHLMPHMPNTSTACGRPIFRMRFCMPMSGRRWEKERYRGGA